MNEYALNGCIRVSIKSITFDLYLDMTVIKISSILSISEYRSSIFVKHDLKGVPTQAKSITDRDRQPHRP